MIPALEKLYGSNLNSGLPLPSELSRFYGALRFPSHLGRPYIINNFASTVDGVMSLYAPGKAVGDVISDSMIL